jgi:hypothetical protein
MQQRNAPMPKTVAVMLSMLLLSPVMATAQTSHPDNRQPSPATGSATGATLPPNAGKGSSSSSGNTPSTGEPARTPNPSANKLPDTAGDVERSNTQKRQ